MKQVIYGDDGRIESMAIVEAPIPRPGPGEILIAVRYAGVNRPDLMQRAGRYPPPAGASPVLGLEVAGEVAAVGEGVSQWKVGAGVTALVPGGGYAEYSVAPAGHALPIPAGLSVAEAASLPETWFTVWANLADMGQLSAGERLLVHGGSSGIGLSAIQLARHLGAEPYVTVGSEDKAAFCCSFGAVAAINYRTEDFSERVKTLTGGDGVDVILDMVGGDYVQKNLQLLRRDGRLVMIAFQQGSKVAVDLMPVLVRRLTVTGSTMRPRTVEEKTAIRDALLKHIWPALAEGSIRTHVHAVFPIDAVADAHRLMESGQHIGKIVLAL